MGWEIKFYQNRRGEEPVKTFILDQDPKVQQKVSDAIEMLRNSGHFLMPPYMKKLLPNLYELRVKSKVAVRVFYSPKTGAYYLLHAFIKKTQKTPDKELRIAIDRMKELL